MRRYTFIKKALYNITASKTDSGGGYKITNLENGNYQLRIKLPTGYEGQAAAVDNDFVKLAPPNDNFVAYSFTVNTAVETQRVYKNVDAGLYALPGTISGTVWRSMGGTTQ